MIGLLLSLAFAADFTEDPRARALLDELERERVGLRLPDAPPLYHLRYYWLSLEQRDANAAYGALIDENAQPANLLAVEVRVGTPAFDNTNFGGWQTGFAMSGVPRDVDAAAMRLAAWRLTDGAYKEAVEQHARKSAQFSPPKDYPGDYELAPTPTRAAESELRSPLAEDAAARVVAISAAITANAGPRVARAEAWLGQETGFQRVIDSEGALVESPVAEATLRAWAQVRADDGALLTDHRLWTAEDAASWPAPEQMVAEAEALGRELAALAAAPRLDEEYVGPVLFEDGAAADLFRWILVPQLEGTPPEIPFETWLGDIGEESDAVRLGRRVLPTGWDVWDDPTGDKDLPGYFLHDAEGTPARRVDLVEDGIVRDLLLTRVPREGTGGSNGHARGTPGGRLTAHAAQLTVAPERAVSEKKLYKAAFKLAEDYDRDWIVVVRRLAEPQLQRSGSEYSEYNGGLPTPVSIVKRHRDGREEVLRGAAFAGVQRFVLRDIVAAGAQVDHVYLASSSGDPSWLGPTEGMPTWISAPEVLIGEMELIPVPSDPRRVPVLPPP